MGPASLRIRLQGAGRGFSGDSSCDESRWKGFAGWIRAFFAAGAGGGSDESVEGDRSLVVTAVVGVEGEEVASATSSSRAIAPRSVF